MSQHIDLNIGLIVEFLLVSDDLQSHIFLLFMIINLDALAKRTFSNMLDDLEPIGNMITDDYFVISSIIVIAWVVFKPLSSFDLVAFTDEPYLFEIKYLGKFVIC